MEKKSLRDMKKSQEENKATEKVDLKDITDKAVEEIEDKKGLSGAEDIKGVNGKGTEIIASRTGKKFYILPCCLDDIEEVTELVKNFENAMLDREVGGKKFVPATPTEISSYNNYQPLKAIKKLMALGLSEDQKHLAEEVGKHFSLGDFPKIYKIVLDLNDFLSGMRTLYQ